MDKGLDHDVGHNMRNLVEIPRWISISLTHRQRDPESEHHEKENAVNKFLTKNNIKYIK